MVTDSPPALRNSQSLRKRHNSAFPSLLLFSVFFVCLVPVRKLINNLVFPDHAKIAAGNAFQVSAVVLQGIDLPHKLQVLTFQSFKPLLNLLLLLVQVVDAQKPPVTEYRKIEYEGDRKHR